MGPSFQTSRRSTPVREPRDGCRAFMERRRCGPPRLWSNDHASCHATGFTPGEREAQPCFCVSFHPQLSYILGVAWRPREHPFSSSRTIRTFDIYFACRWRSQAFRSAKLPTAIRRSRSSKKKRQPSSSWIWACRGSADSPSSKKSRPGPTCAESPSWWSPASTWLRSEMQCCCASRSSRPRWLARCAARCAAPPPACDRRCRQIVDRFVQAFVLVGERRGDRPVGDVLCAVSRQ